VTRTRCARSGLSLRVLMAESDGAAAGFAPIDASGNQIVGVFGRKGSGKSTLANMLQRVWPGVDKLTVDITGTDRPSHNAQRVTLPPRAMPERDKPEEPVDLWYVPDPTAPTYRDDLDRALRAGLFPQHRKTLVTIHEVGEVLPVGQTPPHGRLLLQQGRHYNASTILCGPRPQQIEPLALSQCDEVFMYDVPNPRDRRRLADTLGISPRELDEAFNEVRAEGKHWFLRYRAALHELTLNPPLPREWREEPVPAH
jgi:energy-coupling factor transporter ATP-binding protein EcfA2